MAISLDRRIKEAAEQRTVEDEDSDKRWVKAGKSLIEDLTHNMQQRIKAHGATRDRYALELHKMKFDETYFDVYDGDARDFKVRLFFEPLIGVYKGDRKKVLSELKIALDRYFPIPAHLNREWNPRWVKVAFRPKRRSDTRTARMTIQFDWSIKKAK